MLFRAKPDSPEGGLRPPAGDAPPPRYFLYFFKKKQPRCRAAWSNILLLLLSASVCNWKCMCASSDEDGTLSSR